MLKNSLYIFILCAILGYSIFGRNGAIELNKFESQLADLKGRLRELHEDSNAEANSLYGINNSPGYLEKISREDLGLSKKEDIIYVFEEKK